MQEPELTVLVVVWASTGPSWFHWGRALRMALTSSATAVKANSNWSWIQQETTIRQSEVANSKTYNEFFRFESKVKMPNKGRLLKNNWRNCQRRLNNLGANHAGPLIPDMLQRCGNVDLLHSCGDKTMGYILAKHGELLNYLYEYTNTYSKNTVHLWPCGSAPCQSGCKSPSGQFHHCGVPHNINFMRNLHKQGVRCKSAVKLRENNPKGSLCVMCRGVTCSAQ